jgi:hypothetical protein
MTRIRTTVSAVVFPVAHVFDVSQTDGEPLPGPLV